MEVRGTEIRALVDTGAQGNFISPRIVNRLKLPWKRKLTPYRLRTVDGELVTYGNGIVDMETAHIQVRIQDHCENLTCDITDITDYDLVLGIPWLRASNPRVNWNTGQFQWDTPGRDSVTEQRSEEPSHEPKTLGFYFVNKDVDHNGIPKEYLRFLKLFSGKLDTGLPQHSSFDHEIPLMPGTEPKFMKIYPVKPQHEQALKEYVEDGLRRGIIRASTSPAGFPVLLVPRKTRDGSTKWRVCIDYRELNRITIKNRYPLPLIKDLRDKLHGAQWFTALDLPNAYNLIRIKKGDEWKTAFRTKYGHFEYLAMPFGLTNAPASFQHMINTILREFIDKFVVVYLDDILIYSKTLEEHKQHVASVLSKLQEANLLVSPEKSEFHQRKVTFVGYVISPGEIRMEDSKIAAVRDWPTPTNATEVRSFLGLANYYRMFIPQFGKIGTPLTNLTRKDYTFQWQEEEQKAFETLKQRITDEPVLIMANPDKEFEVETDASDYAIGGQLSQRGDDGKLHPVAYYSKKLHGPELNYQIHDKELMAIIEALREWRHYLTGTEYTVKIYTDHKNLTSFATSKELNKRQVRWTEFLADYNFTIIYRKGSENGRADALSRRPDHFQEVPPETGAILKINKDGNLVPTASLYATSRIVIENSWIERFQPYHRDNEETQYNGKIRIPAPLVEELISEHHEPPYRGHMGIFKTLKKIQQTFDCPGLREHVRTYIKNCELCNKSKASRHKPYGELMPITPPDRPWKSIALDFIVKLPGSKEPLTNTTYDSVLVITERLTKYAYFIPYKEASNTTDLAYTMLRNVICQHGLPDEIISDRDKLFTAKFWQSLMTRLGVRHKLSTAYHPQTDGQTERTNQTLEQYLRCYVNYEQDNWVQLLPLAQFAFNSAVSEPTGLSPFYANYGYEPDIAKEPILGKEAPKAVEHADELKELHQALQRQLLFIQQRMTKYYDKKRIAGPTFRRGDKVYLLRRNIKTKRPNDKLDFRKIGPFKIEEVISKVNYRLSLPKTMRIHPTVHVALLEPAPSNAKLETDLEAEQLGQQEYEVEQVLRHRKKGRGYQYEIKWKDYPPEDNTWEPSSHLPKTLLGDYWRHQERAAWPVQDKTQKTRRTSQ